MTRVYLHVGAPKTGTTYAQAVLWRNRDSLRSDGVLYPAYNPEAHLHAALDLQADSLPTGANVAVPGTWERTVSEARSWPGTVVISHEVFATASEHQVARALRALSFAEVHLIFTVRDLGRQIPAVWQEDVKNRHTAGFEEFADAVAGAGDDPEAAGLAEQFWRFQDTSAVLRRWAGAVPPERVHVVTVPPRGESGPHELWRRFAAVLGVDAGRYEIPAERANASLGWAETELLRRLNAAVADVAADDYARVVREILVDRVLAGRAGTVVPMLPARHHRWVRERSEQVVADIRAAGYRVSGDLRDLVPRLDGPVPERPDPSVVLDASTAALAALVSRLGAARRPRDVRQRLRDASYRSARLMRLRRYFWEVRVRLPGVR